MKSLLRCLLFGSIIACAVGCIDRTAANIDGMATSVPPSEVFISIDNDVTQIEVEGVQHRLLAFATPGQNLFESISNVFAIASKPTFLGERVAIECALSHFGGMQELSSLGADSLEGYQMAGCLQGGPILYLPMGTWDEIESALENDAENASSENLLGKEGLVLFLGKTIDKSPLKSISDLGMGVRPIVVDHWSLTGRRYGFWEELGKTGTVLLQIAEVGLTLKELANR